MTAQEVFDRMETLDMDRILTLETLIPITQYDALQIYWMLPALGLECDRKTYDLVIGKHSDQRSSPLSKHAEICDRVKQFGDSIKAIKHRKRLK